MSTSLWITDASYLLHASPRHFDYLRLKHVLEGCIGAPFNQSFYLNSCGDPPSEAQNAFHTWLKTAPPQGPQMRVKLYKLKDLQVKCPSCAATFSREVQKGVDVGIATLIVKLAARQHYDRLVLCAGDGDFEDAIAFAKEECGKEIVISGFHNSVSPDLQSYADRVIWLDDHLDQFAKD
jgi:uncharacterized LabA/DUF88 family protein